MGATYEESRPRWVSAEVAARHLDRTVRAIYHLVKRRHLPCHKLGRKLVFDLKEIDQWLTAKQ